MIDVQEVVAYRAHDGTLFNTKSGAENYNRQNFMSSFSQKVHKATVEDRPSTYQVLQAIVNKPIGGTDCVHNDSVVDFLILVAQSRGIEQYLSVRLREERTGGTDLHPAEFADSPRGHVICSMGGDDGSRGGDGPSTKSQAEIVAEHFDRMA